MHACVAAPRRTRLASAGSSLRSPTTPPGMHGRRTGLVSISNSAVAMQAWLTAASLNAYGANVTEADIKTMQVSVSAGAGRGAGRRGGASSVSARWRHDAKLIGEPLAHVSAGRDAVRGPARLCQAARRPVRRVRPDVISRHRDERALAAHPAWASAGGAGGRLRHACHAALHLCYTTYPAQCPSPGSRGLTVCGILENPAVENERPRPSVSHCCGAFLKPCGHAARFVM